jgi:hypothetical protein
VHLVCDNYGTHKTPAIRRCLEQHPRFHAHYTPTYSRWINQVERWFAYLTDDLLRRSDHRSVQALEKDIRNWVAEWNENPKPFIWTKSAEKILAKPHDFYNELTARDTSSAACSQVSGSGLGAVTYSSTAMATQSRPLRFAS